jgi:hypothetical protein
MMCGCANFRCANYFLNFVKGVSEPGFLGLKDAHDFDQISEILQSSNPMNRSSDNLYQKFKQSLVPVKLDYFEAMYFHAVEQGRVVCSGF